ncbi:MAG: ATP-binding domain-containing protein [Ignisphaera sp.]|nr:ATP-binding domain-containing protein [Ignisphaera sp.]
MEIKYITGYAGTGKSTELLKLLPTLPPKTTVVLAPTHKSLDRLRKEYFGIIELKTIHSLLGLIPRINDKATTRGGIRTLANLDKPIGEYTHIIIDEAGMINEEHFMQLVSKLEDIEEQVNSKIFLYLFMDPYQLLPVKGYQIMPDKQLTTNLITQYRSESTDIVTAYTKFVSYMQDNSNDDLSIAYSANIKPLDIREFKLGDKLLGYTNKEVGEWNKKIAKQLGIKSYVGQEVQIGANDNVIVEEFIQPTLYDLKEAYENHDLILQNSTINSKFLNANLQALLHPDIEFITTEGKIIPVIVGIGKSSLVHKEAEQKALKDRSKFSHIYALNRAYTMDYNFSSTVHKAQGQEFDRVFIDKEDIQKSIMNGYYGNYARLMYVAISRAKKTLYI